MSTLLMRIAAPMQSWGSESRFGDRDTQREPTKSGIIGMLASALGMQRGDSLDRFAHVKFGVRIDQPGRMTCDYQIVRMLDSYKSRGIQKSPQSPKKYFGDKSSISNRMYLCDAVFLVGLESDDTNFLYELDAALKSPVNALFFGRRSCPPTGRITLGVVDSGLEASLKSAPWQASEWYRKTKNTSSGVVEMTFVLDSDSGSYRRKDSPVSFDTAYRVYEYRFLTEKRMGVTVCEPSERPAVLSDSDLDAFGAVSCYSKGSAGI